MLLFFGMIALLYFTLNPSESVFFPKCPLYATTGIYCPGCGSQRAMHSFLHLNLKEVISYNVLFLLGVLILVYHVSVEGINLLLGKKIYNILYHPKTSMLLLVIVIIYWIIRNIPYPPFNLLAPSS